MKMQSVNHLLTAALLSAIATLSYAKLPPPTPEQTAKLEAAKAKAASDAKIEKELLDKAQDRVVARYVKEKGNNGQQEQVPGMVPEQAASIGTTQEVPSAALNSRTTEKAGAYNESVTPQTAGRALATGSQADSADMKQNDQVLPEPEKK
jgi:hypothetical protein